MPYGCSGTRLHFHCISPEVNGKAPLHEQECRYNRRHECHQPRSRKTVLKEGAKVVVIGRNPHSVDDAQKEIGGTALLSPPIQRPPGPDLPPSTSPTALAENG